MGLYGAWCSLVNILVWEASERQFESDRPDMVKKKDKEVKVIAEFEVSSSEGNETIRGFCASWQRLLTLPTPATAAFVRWARIDDK